MGGAEVRLMIHVVPNNDINPHELDVDCQCGAEVFDKMVVHDAYDARDFKEEHAERTGREPPDHEGWSVVDDSDISTKLWH